MRKPLEERQRAFRVEYNEKRTELRNPPPMRQVVTTDATVESLADLLEKNPRGLAFMADELTGWARALGQYKQGKGNDRQHWLSFWSGEDVIVNRKGQQGPIMLTNPHICLAGGLPPDVLGSLIDVLGPSDGFVPRILFAYPHVRHVPYASRESVSEEAAERYRAICDTLWALPFSEGDEPRALTFTPAAQECWFEWADTIAAEIADPSFPYELEGTWGKFDQYCARLSLILHLAREASDEVTNDAVDEESLMGAAALIEYFKSQARRVYGRLTGSPEVGRLEQAAAKIEQRGRTISARDAYTSKIGGVQTAEEAEKLFGDLQEAGYGRIETVARSSGGSPSIVFHLVA